MNDGGIPEKYDSFLKALPEVLQCVYVMKVPVYFSAGQCRPFLTLVLRRLCNRILMNAIVDICVKATREDLPKLQKSISCKISFSYSIV